MNKHGKPSGFKVPENYFETLGEKLVKTIGEEALNLPAKDVFHLPEGYFRTFEKRLMKRLRDEDRPVIRLHRYKIMYRTAAAIAAVLLIIFGFNWTREQPLTFDDLAQSEIDHYLDSQDPELSPYEIAEVLPVDELEIDDIMNTKLEEENILEYLEFAIDDIDELNIETDEE